MKRFFLLFIFLFSFSYIYSQQILNNNSASWSKVYPGKILGNPENTSYGTIFIDESRILHSINFKGQPIWDKDIPRGSNPIFKVLQQDFVVLVTNKGQKIHLLNPTGTEIWSNFSDFEITDIYAGRDGRFFVRNKNFFACYGLNGIKKWQIEINNNTNLPVVEFEDGSLFIFCENKTSNNNLKLHETHCVRLSPFGEILEDIDLKLVCYAESFNAGILLTYSDGSFSLLNIINNKINIIWENDDYINSDLSFQNKALSCNKNNNIIYSKNDLNIVTIYVINSSTGKTINSFTISDIENPIYHSFSDEGLIIADYKSIVFYNLQGKCLWNGILPENIDSKKVKYIYNVENFLLLFYPDWNVLGFRISQRTKLNKTKIQEKTLTYDAFYEIDTSLFDNYLMSVIDSDISSEENINLLLNGNYGNKEKYWIQKLLSGCKAYEGLLFTKNSRNSYETTVFERDTAGLERMLFQLSLFGTNTFCDFTSYLIKYESNRTILNAVLNSLKSNGYDPEGKILQSLYLLAKKTDIKDSTVSIEICDCVYTICKFMGKPAFNKQGKEILTTFIYLKFNQKTKEYARETLKKISALDL